MKPASIRVCVQSLIAIAAVSTPAHASLSSPDRNEPVTLVFACGRQVEGRYRGLLGTITAERYPARYDAWRSHLGLVEAPGLGDSVLVLRSSTAPARGVCRGFVNDALLLGRADGCADLVLPLAAIDAVVRVDASAPDSSWTGVRQRWKHAPSLCVVAVQVGDTTLAAPPTSIAATVRHDDPGSAMAGGLMLGVVVGGLLASWALASMWAHGHFPG